MNAAVITDETAVPPLAAEQLYRPANLSDLAFSTTADLQPIDALVGQDRAAEAIRFGMQVDKTGFNLFVIGPPGIRMQDAVKAMLAAEAVGKPKPSDWVYVNNFVDPEKPIAIELAAGRARDFHDAMHKLIDDLKSALPAVFQSEDYQTRQSAIDESFQKRQGEAFSALRDRAAEKDVALLRTPLGFALAPVKDGKVVPPDEFSTWPEAKRREVQADIEALEKELEHIVRQIPRWETQRRDETRQLGRDTAKYAVDQFIEDTKQAFTEIPRVVQHIETVRSDLIENFGMFVMKGNDEGGDASEIKMGGPFDRYEVNVLVTLDGAEQAPIIEELHPALGNLIGRIEYVPLHGALLTNFRLVKAGAIHRANGGYLLLDARSVLMEPFSWAAVKRTLRRGEIAIEDIGRFLGLTSTVSLEPDPIPLNLKVILFGDRLLYFLLAALDPELQEHFKVLADFENDLARTPENEADFARLLAALAQREGLNALDREGVALMLEHTARSAEHSGKLSLAIEQVREILVEADFCARAAKRSAISREDVDGALKARIRRAARLRDRAQEAILEKVALIDTSGTHIGQINGLSVTELGGFSFGRPTRITCQVRPGAGKVIDIEREVELGGPLHSKGVLILSGFLAGRYALDTPMSLSASLVFEQSHGGVEGDSASSAELYALLSAIAEVPLRQDLAATGSVNQHGQLQAIGRVNEKIEGFFDTCERRGLTGTQGVLIPQSNVQHLMLRKDVRDACAAGRFAVYPVATLDEGIALLTGLSAGMRGTDGAFPLNSVNRRVEDRLRSFCQHSTEFYRSEQQLWSSGQLAMRKGPHSFRRIVLGLQPGAHERTMQLAVELADLLHLDLLGLLLEDTSLRDLANIPFSREFRLLDGGWHAIDLDRVAHDFELAARIIKRKFTEAAKGLPTGSQFEIARKSLTETFASVSRTDDIIMIVEPQNPAERATQQFSWLLEAALRSAAAVMLVPPRVARTKGPIVAIGQSADDPGIHTAAAIALATKEELVILEADGGDDNEPLLRELTADHSLSVQHIRIDSMGLTDPAVCAQIFRRVQERLIVIARGTFENDFVSTIAATRRVPVLIVEPLESPSKEST